MKSIFIIIFLTTHIWLALKGTILIEKSNLDSPKRKLNTVILWIIPFIWYFVLRSIVKRIPGSFEFPEKRDSGPYYENGDGAPGAGIRDH